MTLTPRTHARARAHTHLVDGCRSDARHHHAPPFTGKRGDSSRENLGVGPAGRLERLSLVLAAARAARLLPNRQQQARVAVVKLEKLGLHANVNRLRLLEEGARDGDGFDGLVGGLRANGLQRRAVDRCPRLRGDQHCDVARLATTPHFGQIISPCDSVVKRIRHVIGGLATLLGGVISDVDHVVAVVVHRLSSSLLFACAVLRCLRRLHTNARLLFARRSLQRL